MPTIDVRREAVAEIVQATFPHYNGKQFEINITENVSFYGTMWDEGNRRTYKMVRLADMAIQTIPQERFMDMKSHQRNNAYYPIPSGCVIVVFREGRRDGIEVHGLAENLTPMLPKPTNLTDDEKIVLMATRSLKSSYAGIKDYRFQEARRHRGITKERYHDAKESLMDKRLLNRAGAITVEGRNAIGDERL